MKTVGDAFLETFGDKLYRQTFGEVVVGLQRGGTDIQIGWRHVCTWEGDEIAVLMSPGKLSRVIKWAKQPFEMISIVQRD